VRCWCVVFVDGVVLVGIFGGVLRVAVVQLIKMGDNEARLSAKTLIRSAHRMQ
jgi:hypothetical protein